MHSAGVGGVAVLQYPNIHLLVKHNIVVDSSYYYYDNQSSHATLYYY